MQEIKYTCTSKKDEQAVKIFHEVLKGLPNYSGLALISIEGFCDHIYYNQITKGLEKLSFEGGYTSDSFVASKNLTSIEEDQFYSDLRRGGISVYIRYKISYKSAGMKDTRILNISPMIKEIKEDSLLS